MNWLCVPPYPMPPSPAPAWLGRCEGSDFTACQLRPKNTQNSEMLGQGEERAGPRMGWWGVRWQLGQRSPLSTAVLLGSNGQRCPDAPSGPTSGSDKGGALGSCELGSGTQA